VEPTRRDGRAGGNGAAAEAMSPDPNIRGELAGRLAAHPYLQGQGVCVEVVNGVVHLFGTVDTRLAKQAAWDVAWSVAAVVDVEIEIRLGGSGARAYVADDTRWPEPVH
jgi:osmotically-inducible protein OsmY